MEKEKKTTAVATTLEATTLAVAQEATVQIPESKYKALVFENTELSEKLEKSEADNKQKDITITKLSGMLKDAAQESTKVVIPKGPTTEYQGKVYESKYPSFWLPGQDKLVHIDNLSDAQKAYLIEKQKLVLV